MFVLPTALLVFLYGKYAKSRGIFGNIIRGMIIVIAFFFGVVAINQSFVEIPFGIVLLSVVFFIHDTNSNLIGAIRDVEGDQKGGYLTFPVKYGTNISLVVSIVLSIIYETLLIISIFVFQFLQYPLRFYALFIVSPLILIIMYVFLIWSRSTMDHRKALRAHEFMVAERITLASALIIGMTVSYLLSLSIYIIAIGFSLISQLVLRKRYEYVE